MTRPIRIGIIGCGSWGINHVRTVAADPLAVLQTVCDPSKEARERATARAGGVKTVTKASEIFADESIEAVIIASPAITHAELTKRALAAGKHVLVEKPIALSSTEARELDDEARRRGLTLAVGHLMLYHPAIEHLRALLRSGKLGELYYLYAKRVNLGRLRSDENALWSFGPHDLSIVDYLLGELPVRVSACGRGYLQQTVEDVVFLTLHFAGGQMAHIHLSWLNPRKERQLTLVCSQKMVEFDDVSGEKLRIYDKGYDRPPEFTDYSEYLTIRQGDIHIPHLVMAEPLALETRHFLDCVRTGATPRTDGASALRVVQILEAAQRSLERGGASVDIDGD